MRILIASTLLLSLLRAPATLADGMCIADGRFAGGKATLLTLTPQQALTARTKRVVVLTPSQQRRLAKAAHVAPTVLELYVPAVAKLDCTCFAFNVALLIAPTEIEVPHRYLVSDAEAARKTEEFERSVLLDASDDAEPEPR